MSDQSPKPLAGSIMGSKSDWEVMKAASAVLTEFGVAHESRAISAHRSPELAADCAKSAEEQWPERKPLRQHDARIAEQIALDFEL